MSSRSERGPGERGGGIVAEPAGELGSGAASSDRSEASMSWALEITEVNHHAKF